MQIITSEMIITPIGTYFDITRKLIAMVFTALYQNIGHSFNNLIRTNHKLGAAFVIVGSIVMLIYLAKARKFAFVGSLFDKWC